MTVIFQLFSAEDLKNLNEDKLEELRALIGNRVGDTQDTSLRTSLDISSTIKRKLRDMSGSREIANHQRYMLDRKGRAPKEPPSIPQESIPTLRKRASEVFQQLKSRPPSGQPGPLNLAKPIFEQLLSPEDFDKLDDRDKLILEWAITCEVTNFKPYNALQHVKEQAEEKFRELTDGQRPKGPDSLYSPFYPLNPLYDPEQARPNP